MFFQQNSILPNPKAAQNRPSQSFSAAFPIQKYPQKRFALLGPSWDVPPGVWCGDEMFGPLEKVVEEDGAEEGTQQIHGLGPWMMFSPLGHSVFWAKWLTRRGCDLVKATKWSDPQTNDSL